MPAAVGGDTQRIGALLGAGTPVDAREDGAGDTPLMMATLADPVDAALASVAFLLGHGANVNGANRGGDTVLIRAAGRSGPAAGRLVAALLAAGADRSLKNAQGQDALAVARQRRNAEVVELLRGH